MQRKCFFYADFGEKSWLDAFFLVILQRNLEYLCKNAKYSIYLSRRNRQSCRR